MIKFKSILWSLQRWHILMLSLLLPLGISHAFYHVKKITIGESRLSLSLELSALLDQQLASNASVQLQSDQTWFIHWDSDLKIKDKSPNAPELTPVESLPTNNFEQTEDFCILYHTSSTNGHLYAVGTSSAPLEQTLSQTLTLFVSVGSILCVSILAGGYYTAKRSLKPIERISQTARHISNGSYEERIDTQSVENELKELSDILNKAFEHIDHTLEIQRNFTSDASHELKTPISVLILELESALRRERSPSEYRERIEGALVGAKRLEHLAESLLEISQIESGETPLNKAPHDIKSLSDDVVQSLTASLEEHGVTLQNTVHSQSVEVDGVQISRVLTNLLTNAIHHTLTGGSITLSSKMSENHLTLSVADTGSGIPADALPYIFDRFYRADKARTSSQKRTGLGLSICQSILHAHEGEITIDSIEGKGTKVTVALPITPTKIQSA